MEAGSARYRRIPAMWPAPTTAMTRSNVWESPMSWEARYASRSSMSARAPFGENFRNSSRAMSITSCCFRASTSISSPPPPRWRTEARRAQAIRSFSRRVMLARNRLSVIRISRSIRPTRIPRSSAASYAAFISAPGSTPTSMPIFFWTYARPHWSRNIMRLPLLRMSVISGSSAPYFRAWYRFWSSSTATMSGTKVSISRRTSSTDSAETWAVPTRRISLTPASPPRRRPRASRRAAASADAITRRTPSASSSSAARRARRSAASARASSSEIGAPRPGHSEATSLSPSSMKG